MGEKRHNTSHLGAGRARNPALNFMDDEGEVSPAPSSSKSANLSPPVSKTPRPRTSQDKIPKWFKPGGK
ncbi:hypothetical protein M8J77_016248 [Diaphorina citri]|nr:hypothetical protein M8J77_016248 [Diaphorina citri]